MGPLSSAFEKTRGQSGAGAARCGQVRATTVTVLGARVEEGTEGWARLQWEERFLLGCGLQAPICRTAAPGPASGCVSRAGC